MLSNTQHFFAPGRVNLIGEHIDYNGGLVLPAAINLGVSAKVQLREDGILRIQSVQAEGSLEINLLQPNLAKRSESWMNYPLGVLVHLIKKGLVLRGMDIYLDSNLPMGSGLSSSAAIEVLVAYILLYNAQHSLANDKVAIAQLSQQVENQFVGVQCGIMDQFAVAMGKEHQAMLLNCDTLDYEYIPFNLQDDYRLLIMNSHKERRLADSKYNERKAECDEALRLLQQHKNTSYLCAAQLSDLVHITDPIIKKRAKHVITENQRVLQASQALQQNDLKSFGDLMVQSHRSLQHDYEVTGFELDTLVDLALQQPACIGARMTGAGFGGCAIALVQTSAISTFIEEVGQAYTKASNLNLAVYETKACNGVGLVKSI